MSDTRRRGFTLLELLVVIAIIALLIGILLPALGKARKEGQNAVSLANLRSLTQVQLVYTNDTNGAFVNPFGGPEDCSPSQRNGYWFRVARNASAFTCAGPGTSWEFSESNKTYETEMWAFHWASKMGEYLSDGDFGNKVQFSPADPTPYERFLELQANYPLDSVLWDTSYVYSPTFWFSPARYEVATAGTTRPNGTLSMWRRNYVANVLFPAQKVITFERFDTTQETRYNSVLGAREQRSPNWNNPQARARIGTVDGSVIVQATAEQDLLVTSPKQKIRDAYTPAGLWDPAFLILRNYEMARDGLEHGANPFTGNTATYPAYYWATANGIQGRDIER